MAAQTDGRWLSVLDENTQETLSFAGSYPTANGALTFSVAYQTAHVIILVKWAISSAGRAGDF